MRSLQRAVDSGWRALFWAQHEPQYSSLWGRADFKALMQKLARMNELMRAKVQEANVAQPPLERS